jgi:hypothetical protein
MPKYRVVIDPQPTGFHPLMVDAEGDLDTSRFATMDLAGQPMVRINEWLVSRDRIVAIVPEDTKERQRAQGG